MIASIYADGGTIGKNPSKIGGTWAWCGVDETGSRVIEASGFVSAFIEPVTNNQTEFLAILYALETMEDGWTGMVCSDSQLTLGRFFHGWKNKNISNDLIHRAQVTLNRLGKITPVHLSGHPSKKELKNGLSKNGRPVSEHNVYCDKLCSEMAVTKTNENQSR